MIIECRNCGFQEGEPEAIAGITTLLPASFGTAIVCAILVPLLPAHLGRWVIFLALPLWIFLSWLFAEIPCWQTSWRYGRHPCPQCGVRAWKKPRYSGFGL